MTGHIVSLKNKQLSNKHPIKLNPMFFDLKFDSMVIGRIGIKCSISPSSNEVSKSGDWWGTHTSKWQSTLVLSVVSQPYPYNSNTVATDKDSRTFNGLIQPLEVNASFNSLNYTNFLLKKYILIHRNYKMFHASQYTLYIKCRLTMLFDVSSKYVSINNLPTMSPMCLIMDMHLSFRGESTVFPLNA